MVTGRYHRQQYLGLLDPARFDESELRSYYNDFTETDEPAAGRAMLDGIKALGTGLAAALDGTVVLLQIG